MARNKGRTPLPAEKRRSRHLHLYLTPPEYTLVRQLRKRSESGSDFLRRLLLPLAERLIAEREAAKEGGAPPGHEQGAPLPAQAGSALAHYQGLRLEVLCAEMANTHPEWVLRVVAWGHKHGLSHTQVHGFLRAEYESIRPAS